MSQAKQPRPPNLFEDVLALISPAGVSFYHNSTPFSKLFGETSAPVAGSFYSLKNYAPAAGFFRASQTADAPAAPSLLSATA
eukprot:1693166-Pyramimonas_sp.AAC.1